MAQSSIEKKTQFYINGCWVDPVAATATATNFDVINPATEAAVARISLATDADVDAAVTAARNALPLWQHETDSARRIELVGALLEAYMAREADISAAMHYEMGAPQELAKGHQFFCGVAALQGYIAAAQDPTNHASLFQPTPVLEFGMDTNSLTMEEGVGVCGLITPWNWPMNQVTLKVGAALLAGCTVVLKPSEYSPLSAMVFAECVQAAGIPPGVFNLINGSGEGAGSYLSRHPDVDCVSFTGSTRAGRLIAAAAAATTKRVHLELGGKNANIIFDDCTDLKSAVKYTLEQMMLNSGQTCNAPSRMMVQRSVYDEAVRLTGELAAGIKCENENAATTSDDNNTTDNNPNTPWLTIGPLVNKRQYDTVRAQLEQGVKEGARVLVGGPTSTQPQSTGYYVNPTVFVDVDPNTMPSLAKEEIFGPVLMVMPFDTEEEAVTMYNSTFYGLQAFVQTENMERKVRLARRLKAGMVEFNQTEPAPAFPFGGMKQSGYGREGGIWGIKAFMETKYVAGISAATTTTTE